LQQRGEATRRTSHDQERTFLEASQKEMSLFAHFLQKRFFEKGRFMKEWSPANPLMDPPLTGAWTVPERKAPGNSVGFESHLVDSGCLRGRED
jgi:hypothetical protein